MGSRAPPRRLARRRALALSLALADRAPPSTLSRMQYFHNLTAPHVADAALHRPDRCGVAAEQQGRSLPTERTAVVRLCSSIWAACTCRAAPHLCQPLPAALTSSGRIRVGRGLHAACESSRPLTAARLYCNGVPVKAPLQVRNTTRTCGRPAHSCQATHTLARVPQEQAPLCTPLRGRPGTAQPCYTHMPSPLPQKNK